MLIDVFSVHLLICVIKIRGGIMKRVFFVSLVLLMVLSVSIAYAAPKPQPVSVTVSPDQPTIQVGNSIQMKASVISNLNKKMTAKVTWSCEQGGTISKSGKFKAGNAAAFVLVTATVNGTQISDSTSIRIIPVFTGTYIGSFESDEISGKVSFSISKNTFKVLFLPETMGNDSVLFSGKVYSNGTLTAKYKKADTRITLDGLVLDGQNLTADITVNTFNQNDQPLIINGTISALKNINPVSGGYSGYWTDSKKGKVVAILDDNGKTYNLAEGVGDNDNDDDDQTFYFEGTWSGTNVNATFIDPGTSNTVNFIGTIKGKVIKGYVNNSPTKPTKITITKI